MRARYRNTRLLIRLERAMEGQQPELAQILTTNHPARPYLVGGGVLAALGLLRGSWSGLGFLGIGGLLLAKGFQEIKRVEELHGGNYHGNNSPPSNR
jgi:hypothetical protein